MNAVNYELSKLAEEDVRGIWDYTADRWGEDQAENYLRNLEESIKEVANQLEGLTQDRSDLKKGVRSFLYEKHVVFLKEKGGALLVLRILHQRMDIQNRKI